MFLQMAFRQLAFKWRFNLNFWQKNYLVDSRSKSSNKANYEFVSTATLSLFDSKMLFYKNDWWAWRSNKKSCLIYNSRTTHFCKFWSKNTRMQRNCYLKCYRIDVISITLCLAYIWKAIKRLLHSQSCRLTQIFWLKSRAVKDPRFFGAANFIVLLRQHWPNLKSLPERFYLIWSNFSATWQLGFTAMSCDIKRMREFKIAQWK